MSDWFRTYGFAEILPGLLVGAYPLDGSDVRLLAMMRITRVLNLVEDGEYPPGRRADVDRALRGAGIEERRMPSQDFGGLAEAHLDAAIATVDGWLTDGQSVYLHCRAGQQRSATVAAGVIAVRQDLDPDAAIAALRRAKPSADPLPHQRQDLLTWWEHHTAGA